MQQQPKTLLDLATDKHPSNKGMTLEEALAQVDRNGGDKELKRIIKEAYQTNPNGKRH